MTGLQSDEARSFDASRIECVTFDFGNTLVPVHAAELRDVVRRTADFAASRWREAGQEVFLEAWADERDRQLRQNLPEMREVDLDQRVIRILARLRGAAVPPPDGTWDDDAAAAWSSPDEIGGVLRAYADAFLAVVAAPPDVGPFLRRLSEGRRLGVISNWPLAELIERYLEQVGWRPFFDAVVVSQAIGWIKPDRRIFDAAARELRVQDAEAVLHVGDDLGADVAGAKAVGWWAAWLRGRPEDSPLPVADAADAPAPDLVLDRLVELGDCLALDGAADALARP